MGKWQNLTAKQKAEVIRFAIQNGVSDINSIRDTYNLYSNGNQEEVLNKVNSSNANFVQRLKDPNRKNIPDWESPTDRISTHKLSVGTDENGNHYIFPEVQEINGELIDFTRPPYHRFAGEISAEMRGDTVRVPSLEDAIKFTETYKQYYPFNNGDNLTHKKSGKEQGESQGLNSSWLSDFAYNPDNGRRPLQSILQDAAIQRTIQQKALQRQAEMEAEREAQRKATHEIYNGMPNPGAGYVSGTDPLLQAIVDMTPAGDAEMATEAASELRNGNLKEAGLLGAALLLPNIFNKGIKEWRAARALKNSEHGLVYTTRNNLTKYNPNLNEETIQALQQAERDYNNGLFTLEHQSELDPIFELGLHTPAGKTAYPEGVEVWYRGLSRSKGKQVGITPEEFEEMWDKNAAAGKYGNLFFGDLNTASSYISGHTNPLEYARITGRNFPKGDDSKLLQLVFPKKRALEIDVNGVGWADLQRLPFGKLSTKEERLLKNMSIAYDEEIKKQKLLQQRLDNYYRRHPEKMQEISQAKWLQELQNKIYESYGKVSKAHRDLMPLYKKKYPFARTADVSAYLTDSNLNGVTLLNIQDNGPKITAWGQLGNVSIRKPVPGNYGKSAIASDFKFDLNDSSIWAFGGKLKSTGGHLYPFSFEKNPYLKTPVVRYDEGGKTYTVKSGDYLGKIAQANGITIADILAVNPGLNADKINIGQVLNIPGKPNITRQQLGNYIKTYKNKGWTEKDIDYLYSKLSTTDWDPSAIVYAMATESSFNPASKNPVTSAKGLAQITDATMRSIYGTQAGDSINNLYTQKKVSTQDAINHAFDFYNYAAKKVTSERDDMSYGRLKTNLLAPNAGRDSKVSKAVKANSLTEEQKGWVNLDKTTYRDLAQKYDSVFNTDFYQPFVLMKK